MPRASAIAVCVRPRELRMRRMRGPAKILFSAMAQTALHQTMRDPWQGGTIRTSGNQLLALGAGRSRPTHIVALGVIGRMQEGRSLFREAHEDGEHGPNSQLDTFRRTSARRLRKLRCKCANGHAFRQDFGQDFRDMKDRAILLHFSNPTATLPARGRCGQGIAFDSFYNLPAPFRQPRHKLTRIRGT